MCTAQGSVEINFLGIQQEWSHGTKNIMTETSAQISARNVFLLNLGQNDKCYVIPILCVWGGDTIFMPK